MQLPEIFRYAAEFGAIKESVEYNQSDREIWFEYIDNNELVGMIHMTVETGVMCMFHPYILKDYAYSYVSMITQFFSFFCAEVRPQLVKLNCAIGRIFRPAIKAAVDVGMTKEGIDRMSYLTKNGPCDRVLFGITRDEMLCQKS